MKRTVDMQSPAMERNQRQAEANRALFHALGVRVFNLISSPGAGKTTLLEATADRLKERLAVIVGDLATARDADRIRRHGCQAVQIETGGGCHLNAEQVAHAFTEIKTEKVKVLIIENVGNLVCPSAYDLGEEMKIGMLSLPEGDDKPGKYPTLFLRTGLVLINKMDLAPVMDYDFDRVYNDCRTLNPGVRFLSLAAKTGLGLDDWNRFLTGEG
ncbi:MAG: hydrogenase nickel incorporation protein HypB [Fibrobacterota bacterium]